jgi:hypothetical protein
MPPGVVAGALGAACRASGAGERAIQAGHAPRAAAAAPAGRAASTKTTIAVVVAASTRPARALLSRLRVTDVHFREKRRSSSVASLAARDSAGLSTA